MAKTYREALLRASSFLKAAGKEAYSIEFVFLARKNWDKTQWLLNMNQVIPLADEKQIELDLAALLQNQPPQYLLGYAYFYTHKFKVNEATLIPRPETEELVDWCLRENKDLTATKKVVDVGTGTGAIGISLKLARMNWQVTVVDIVPETLAVAKENAIALNADISFELGDTLSWAQEEYDIIISNPPYISPSEWELMDESVREFEPKTALFAADNGLAIYRKLAQQAQKVLAPDGQIFLEIGFKQGAAVAKIFQAAFPTKTVIVKKDLSGNERMVYVY
ncbi:release factor glutamine methyltransferase [Enterococcus saigonensis]|uniref:Release factor glutamine methyltransferase n=1 Tax=Enterococcus saigonensis TaxID=1805431 RepID=A0A679IGD6_9ENTE|nr:peptide chain release factor N(5)-glutamine methyltransferase [Enterococcus saigonensis]BCA84912.1 release factor glutamine methyltransferase [Enterococcus saigonensis]